MNDRAARRDAKPSICFVALNAYGLLAGRDDIQHIGGAEAQQILIARELAKRGYTVSFVVLDHGQHDAENVDGIRVFKAYRRGAGIHGLRFVYPRWSSLWAAMARADADVYYQRVAGVESGQAALWCRWKQRGFILAIAKPPECDRRFGGMSPRRERLFFRYALRHATVIVAQTSTQQRMLAENFGFKSVIIRSCTALPESAGDTSTAAQRVLARRVLWVGRLIDVKRPAILASLAEHCPELIFDVVGSSNAPDLSLRSVVGRLRGLQNLTLHGYMLPSRLDGFFRRATILLCTSEWEGFPNTFLEAWARGLPTVSTIDPDQVVQDHRLGLVAPTVSGLRTSIQHILSSPRIWSGYSERVLEYVRKHHAIHMTGNAYEKLLSAMSSNSSD